MKFLIDDLINVINKPPLYFIVSMSIMLFLAIFLSIMGIKIEKMDIKSKPNRLKTVLITLVDGLNQFIKGYVGKHWRYITPFILTMALYVFISNIVGIIALPAPTQFTAVTFSMSLMAFYIVQSTGLRSMGAKHFLGVFKPLWPMFPLNVTSEFVPILSMAMRLFGNIAGGALIMTLIYGLTSWASIVVAPVFHLIFDIGFGLIQTAVICLLTIIFASMKISDEDLIIN
jgi:F-type H+-transporting ATPase subunit a